MGLDRGLGVSVLLCVAASWLQLQSVAGSSLVVFGDSLSDDGSGSHEIVRAFFSKTDVESPPQQPPSPPYWKGRWSNGPVWAEVASQKLGLSLVNLAVGGSSTGAGGLRFWEGNATAGNRTEGYKITIPSMWDQVQKYTPGSNPGSDIAVIFIGGNDFYGPAGSEPPAVIAAVRSAAHALIDKGFRRFVFLTYILPFASELAFLDPKFEDFNARLKSSVRSDFGDRRSGVRAYVWDAAAEYKDIEDNARSLGFTEVSKPCMTRATGSDFFDCYWYDEWQKAVEHSCKDSTGISWTICGNPDEHLVWDSVHPTAAAHKVLGDRFAKFLRSEADMIS